MGSYQVKLKHHFSLGCYQFKSGSAGDVREVNHDNNKVLVMKILITVTNKQIHAEKGTKIHYKSYCIRSCADSEIANLVLSLPYLVLDSLSYAP